jgi:polyisoprenoid-binding protein YceI
MSWAIDPFHTLVEFSVWHFNINIVKGRFRQVRGSIHLDRQHPENSWVKAQIDANSLDTGVEARDRHLRSADFFEVATFPTITFESNSVQQVNERTGIVSGPLTLHGVTQTVSLQTQVMGFTRDPQTDGWRVGILASTFLDRRSFQMNFQPSGMGSLAMVGYKVQVAIHVEAVYV